MNQTIRTLLTGCAITVGLFTASFTAANAEKMPEDVINLVPQEIRDRGVIRVGSQQTFPPVEFREPGKSEVVGVSSDLLAEVADRLGLKVEYIHGEYSSLIPGVEAGRFDMASGGISDNETREKKLDFVNYMMSGGSILVRDDEDGSGLDHINKFCGRSVATLLGSRIIMDAVEKASAICEANGDKPITAEQLPSAPDARMQLDLKRVDGYLGDFPALVYMIETMPGRYQIAGGNFVLTPYVTSWGFGKDANGLRDAVQKTMQGMLEDGTYAILMGKWGLGGGALPEITINKPASKR